MNNEFDPLKIESNWAGKMMTRKRIMTGLKTSRLISQSNNRTGNIQETGNKSICNTLNNKIIPTLFG